MLRLADSFVRLQKIAFQLVERSVPALLVAQAGLLVVQARMCEREFGSLDNGAKPDLDKRLAGIFDAACPTPTHAQPFRFQDLEIFAGTLMLAAIEHAKAHFELEEQLMAQHHYPKSDQHKAEHAMLIDQALNYRATFAVDAVESPVAVAHFPEVWLAFHILFSDKDLADFLARSA